MNPRTIAKQIISFNKTVFDNNFNAMNELNAQAERAFNKLWEKSPVFSQEGKKAVSEWMKTYKKSWEDFKNAVDENFKKAEDFFNESKQHRPLTAAAQYSLIFQDFKGVRPDLFYLLFFGIR